MKEHAFSSINKGDVRVFRRRIDEGLITMFSVVTGDVNPLHLDDEFAGQTLFGGRIAHGMFTASLISAALSTFPGVVVYLSQNLRFVKPVRPGDEIEALATVIEKWEERNELQLQTLCKNQKDEIVLEGEARIRIL